MKAVIILLGVLLSSASYAAECKTGCAIAKHGEGPLGSSELVAWLDAYQDSAPDSASVALETLLYHGDQVRAFIAKSGFSSLDAAHRLTLKRELNRVQAVVEARLVASDGEVISHLQPTEVRVGEKTHLHVPGLGKAPAFEISGTVMRVGVAHLWARL